MYFLQIGVEANVVQTLLPFSGRVVKRFGLATYQTSGMVSGEKLAFPSLCDGFVLWEVGGLW